MDKRRSAVAATSSLFKIFAPAAPYLSSLAKAAVPALLSTTTLTFHFFKVARCSGSRDTLVSGDGSFKTPIIIINRIGCKVLKIAPRHKGGLKFLGFCVVCF